MLDWLTQPAQAIGNLLAWLISFFSCFFLQLLRWVLSALGYIGSLLVLLLPSTPDNLKLSALLGSIASQIPFVSVGEITQIFIGLSGLFVIYITIKVIKLLPLM